MTGPDLATPVDTRDGARIECHHRTPERSVRGTRGPHSRHLQRPGRRRPCPRRTRGGAADVLEAFLVVVPAQQQRPRSGQGVGDRVDDRLRRLARLVLLPPRTEGRYGSSNRLKNTPSVPTDAHVSHSRTVSASVVDGHSAHGADSRRAANTDSSAARRRRYGQPVVSVPDSRSRSNATKWAGHSLAARTALAPRRASLSCSRSKASRPAASQTISSPPSAVASGSCAAPATISGNAGAISEPRLERSAARPASTETSARKPSFSRL